jgi:hypothetical protein
MQETVATDALAAQKARTVICEMCWALPGRCCSVSGPPGDHLCRWVQAERAGLVTRVELAEVIAALPVVAGHVYVYEDAR